MESLDQEQATRIDTSLETVEMRARVSEAQAETYKGALAMLMERSGDNIELVNALNEFVREINIKSWRGNSAELMPEGYVERLTEFFRDATKELKDLP